MHAFVYVCIIYVYIIYVYNFCVYMYINTYAHKPTHTEVCIHVCTCVYMHVYLFK